jgi:tetratricopeptide (TPR) repeat protein
LQLRTGKPGEGAVAFERALAGAAPADEALLASNAGVAYQEIGEGERARASFERALAAAERDGDAVAAAGALGSLAALAHEAAEFERAAEGYDWAIRRARDAGARRLEGLFSSWRAGALASAGDPEGARACLEVARTCSGELGDASLSIQIELHEAVLLAAQAHLAIERSERMQLRARAEAAARRERDLPLDSDEVRLSLRLLLAALQGHAWQVAEDGGWFAPPGGERVELGSRKLLRRLLAALVVARQAHPDEPVQVEALLAAGWPGEQMDHRSALNRVQVAMTTLRKLGFAELLAHDGRGYLLDPAVPLLVR